MRLLVLVSSPLIGGRKPTRPVGFLLSCWFPPLLSVEGNQHGSLVSFCREHKGEGVWVWGHVLSFLCDTDGSERLSDPNYDTMVRFRGPKDVQTPSFESETPLETADLSVLASGVAKKLSTWPHSHTPRLGPEPSTPACPRAPRTLLSTC